jgi:hypothetical protein
MYRQYPGLGGVLARANAVAPATSKWLSSLVRNCSIPGGLAEAYGNLGPQPVTYSNLCLATGCTCTGLHGIQFFPPATWWHVFNAAVLGLPAVPANPPTWLA